MNARDKNLAAPSRSHRAGNRVKPLNLALQGGGAHGAFAWGVLDRLLEDGRLDVEGVSATSAGAMNAVVLAHGLRLGGRDGAREALARFWQAISESADRFSPFRQLPWMKGWGGHTLESSPLYLMTDLMLRVFSPYQFNPFNFNPLRQVLEDQVDFEALQAASPIKLFLCATNVETGKVRIFENPEITADAVLASACLPFLFQAVEIDGEHFWDGGYVGNPAIFPLIYHCDCRDVLMVHINPIVRKGVPTTAAEILNRINEVSFNSSLLREMRAIAFVTGLIQKGKLDASEMKELYVHSLRSDETMAELGVSSKLNADWDFLCELRDQGREEASRWLKANFDAIGSRSSIDIREAFL